MRTLFKVTKVSVENTLYDHGMARIAATDFLNRLIQDVKSGYWIEDDFGNLWVDNRARVCETKVGNVFDFAVKISGEVEHPADDDPKYRSIEKDGD